MAKITNDSNYTDTKWYQMTSEETLAELKTTQEGLSDNEVRSRLDEYGRNILDEEKRKSVIQVFLEQFKDLLVIILIVAAIVSIFSGNIDSSIVIFAVLILNSILGVVQHVKAQKSLDSLKNMISPTAKVFRNGSKIEIDSKDIVPGDILVIEAGDMVVADGRIINNYSLQVSESFLTGESTNVDKNDEVITDDAIIAERFNVVYSGSFVTYGRATVVVTGTGMATEMGKIASLMNNTKEKRTPLQISLDKFGSRLAIFVIAICVMVFLLNIYRGQLVIDSLMFAVALAVAAIPEALSSIVTIVQAIGTQKMARENAIVKDLKAVEILGCVSVICSDKTGTLTQNKMTVVDVYLEGENVKPEQLDINNKTHNLFMQDAILTNDSSIVDGKGIGDPTEYSLLEMVRTVNVDDDEIRNSMQRLEELPFDSDRKLMSTKYMLDGVSTVLTKGSLDTMLQRLTGISTSAGVRAITQEDKEAILQKNTEFTEQGLRVLTFGYKEVDSDYTLTLENEKDFVFLGLVAIVDPPREESIQAVADAKSAGIKTVMITGDHKITATAIAKQIGIFVEGDMAIVGEELDAMSDDELYNKIEKISVYARVSPENKIRIVDTWQKKGKIVSMTGDGVNDAPALKKADIGVAMGITGTEVSKDAASMILTDDNFATIIKAVRNGRNVYKNIKNAILFLLSGNTAAILAVLYATALALPAPFKPVHLLFINLLTDSLPAIAIGMESSDRKLLQQKPRDPKEQILTADFVKSMVLQGLLIAIATMFAFHIGFKSNESIATTMAFATLTLARLFHGFNCRSKSSILKIGFKKNKYSLRAFGVGVVLLLSVLLIPVLHSMFEVAVLSIEQMGMILGLAIVPTIFIQLFKLIRNQ